jgi:cell division septal protein FtsQ
VRAQRFTRSAGDSPSLGKVARVHSAMPPKDGRRRRRRSGGPRTKEATPAERHQKKVILAWTVVLILVVLGILTVFFWSWMTPRMEQ